MIEFILGCVLGGLIGAMFGNAIDNKSIVDKVKAWFRDHKD